MDPFNHHSKKHEEDNKDSYKHYGNKHDEDRKQFTTMPISEPHINDGKFGALKAAPGPAVIQNLPPQEGTKEEREARKKALNKE